MIRVSAHLPPEHWVQAEISLPPNLLQHLLQTKMRPYVKQPWLLSISLTRATR